MWTTMGMLADWDHKQVQESTLLHVHVQQPLVEAGRSEVVAVHVKVTEAPKCMFPSVEYGCIYL